MTTKICKTCKENKPVSEFGINRKVDSDNFHSGLITLYKPHCKPCLSILAKQYRDANPGLWKKYRLPNGKRKSYPKEDRLLLSAIRTRMHSAKQNAKRNPERAFTIDADYLYQLWKQQKGLCAISKEPMLIVKTSPVSLSIDKIIPENGYVKGNVQWVVWAINRAKGDLDMHTFIYMCKRVTETCRDYLATE